MHNHTNGGTDPAGDFVANSDGGGACSNTYLELIYVDNSGNEVAVHTQSAWGSGNEYFCGASCERIIISPSAYKQILEVIGSSTSSKGNNSGGTYLYY